MNRRRLDGDAIRDTILAVAGTLNLKMGGVGVIPPLTREEILAARMPQLWPANPDPAEHTRRSIYLQMKRSLTLPMLQIFDAPDTAMSCARRETFHRRAAGAGADEQRVQRWRRPNSSPRESRSRRGEDPEAQVEYRVAAGVRPSSRRRGTPERARLPAAQFPSPPLPADLQHERVYLCRLTFPPQFLQNIRPGHRVAGGAGPLPANGARPSSRTAGAESSSPARHRQKCDLAVHAGRPQPGGHL